MNQAILGGGHGDYRNIVLAPASAQEMFDFMRLAFQFSYEYRLPGFILTDGYVGQLKEIYEIPDTLTTLKITPAADIKTSIYVREGILEAHNWKLLRRFEKLKEDPLLQSMQVSPHRIDDPSGRADLVVLSYGIFSRIGRGAVDRARSRGIPAGLLDLKALSPFPEEKIRALAAEGRGFYILEGSTGQLAERVKSVIGPVPVMGGCQRPGGTLPEEEEVAVDIRRTYAGMKQARFFEDAAAYARLLKASPAVAFNRGPRFERISIEESTHQIEYAAGMEGKTPEKRSNPLMTEKNVYFCSGCAHKHGTDILGEALANFRDFEINLYSPVGCSIFLYDYFRKDCINHIQVPHGRGPSAASATKAARPSSLVVAYQGDGDAYDIGLSELLHAAYRGENITVVIINNGIYGMTGGQLSSSTPLGQISKTSPEGRDSARHGHPIDISRLLSRAGVNYFRRTLIGSPDDNRRFAHVLKQALLHQISGSGMSVVE
ncbi:MAG: hypothetical protein HQL11_06330, partial [Candidatus Omnitrophica bacterium]|nr:hypothetical protein [Candidatus Omnitrophota bacterium]